MPLLIALGLGVVLTPLAMRAGTRLGLVDRPAPDAALVAGGAALKIHTRAVPVLGGAAVAVAALAAPALLGRGPGPWVVAAVALALAAGVVDDAWSLPPWVRVQAHVGAGLLLAADGLRLGPDGALGVVGVVLLVLATTNAVNLVDGQDGLAGGLAAIAAVGLALSASGAPRDLGLATAGALIAFLVWNRPPARVFLGNGGAYAVGVLLAVPSAAVAADEDMAGLLAAGLCLGVFAFELITTVVRRLASGVALAEGDRSHSYDLLAARLGGRTRSTLALWAIGAALSGVGVLIATYR